MVGWTRQRRFWQAGAWAATAAAIVGCAGQQPAVRYLGDDDNRYYRAQATEIDYPLVADNPPDELTASGPPHTVRDLERSEVRDLTLAEAVHTALRNSEIIRRYGELTSPGNSILAAPNQVASVFDPAIQESGVLFGGQGVEAALSAFDATVTSRLVYGEDTSIRNSTVAPHRNLVQESAEYRTAVQKIFGSGGVVSVENNINYLGTNAAGASDLFDSVYTGNIGLFYQQPLLAGSGTQYTRTAGPIVRSFGGITGVSQGVLVARINNDITIADFENSVQQLLYDVETAYWDLYLAYRNFDTATVARNSAMDTWRYTKRRAGLVDNPADEPQSRSALYIAEAATKTAQSNIYTAETELRRLLGIAINDGVVIRPVDEPVSAEVIPDWYGSLTEALGRRVELRQQKWNIKSLELQLAAAESLTQPRLDLVGGFQVNAFGDDLLNYSGPSINSYGQTLTAGNQTGWNVGVQMNVPIGLRSAHAQVRNYELRLLKARKVLEAQELDIGHQLAASFQELSRAYVTMQSSYQAYVAAEQNVQLLLARVLTEDNVDVILRSYQRRADAELTFHRNVVDYNKSLAALQWRKGTILDYNSVSVTEGPWTPEAYYEAGRHADARAHAFHARHVRSSPPDFAADAPAGRSVLFTNEAAIRGGLQPQPDAERPYVEPPRNNVPPPAPGVDTPPPPSQDSAGRTPTSRFNEIAPTGWNRDDAEAAGVSRLGGARSIQTPDQPGPEADDAPARVQLGTGSSLFDF